MTKALSYRYGQGISCIQRNSTWNEKSPLSRKLFSSNNTRNRALVQSTLKRFANTRNSGWRREVATAAAREGGLEITFIAT